MSKKIYVGNLPFSATEDHLRQIFEQIGAVVSTKVISDKMSGRSKGFGFVEMENDGLADDAIAKFNGVEFEGRAMTVAEARPEAPREPGAGGGRGGFGGRGGRGSFGGRSGGGRGGDRERGGNFGGGNSGGNRY